MRDKTMNRIFTTLVEESKGLFIGWLNSEAFQEIQKTSLASGTSQDDLLATFWRKQNELAEMRIGFASQRSARKHKVFSSERERIVREGFHRAVQTVYGSASANSAWERIVAPRFIGFLEKSCMAEWKQRDSYGLGVKKVEVQAFENVLVAIDESGQEIASLDWEQLTSWDSYYIFEQSEASTLAEMLIDPSLRLQLPIGVQGWVHLDPEWAEYLSSKGLPRQYE
jgi:hypothetical protein